MEENNARFTSEIKVELPLFLEFLNLNNEVYSRNTVLRLLQVILVLHCIANMNADAYRFAFFVLAVLLPLIEWRNRQSYRDGGVAYKQLLYLHEGKIPHQILRFEEDQIVLHNLSTGNDRTTPYSQYVQLWESKNLLVLILDLNMYQIIDKRVLTGGTADELIAFLHEKCPKLKHTKGRFGRFLRRMLWVVIAVGIVIAALFLLNIPGKPSGRTASDISYEQMAGELAEVGITISPQTIAELEQYDSENRAGMFLDSNSRVLDLLCWEGQGIYEKNVFYQDGISEAYDWDWTPSTSGVYWFDTEVFNFGSIYTDFLAGICAMDEQLSFSNIEEKYIRVDIPSGKGEIDFSFDYEGTHYELTAEYNYDWFDTDMLYAVGRILANDDDPKDLWFTHGGGQGLLLYYGTEENMQLLETIVGTDFFDCVTMHMGH